MTNRGQIAGALIGLLSLAALAGLGMRPERSAPSTPAAPSAAPPLATGADDASERLAGLPAYRAAARALRGRDCSRAQAALASLRSAADRAGGREAHATRLVSGLYAHACENVALAATRLAAPAPDGWLEDWRLLLLAESAHATGEIDTADAALTTLLEDHPDSPLWERGLLRAVEQASERRRPARVLELVDRSRGRAVLSGEAAAQLETLAWEAATEAGDWVARARAGRRLLTLAPVRADELGVIDLFRFRDTALDGSSATEEIDWRSILTAPDTLRRAEALLDADRPAEALATLDDLAPAERGFAWHLLAARGLTRQRRADEALELLRPLGSAADPRAGAELASRPAPERATRLAWARYRAANDLAAPLRSGSRLSRAGRERMARRAHEQLGRVVAHGLRDGGDRELARSALGRLFADHVEEERFEQAKAALLLLRRLDPDDTTGTGYLWTEGWEQYRRRNYSGAVGYWSELATLYPESDAARAGRYWTARAFEKLGRSRRSRALLEEVAAAGSTDFYRRHALARLQRLDEVPRSDGLRSGTSQDRTDASALPPLRAEDPPAEQPWPRDPVLERARLLTDLGLDDLALAEIESLERRAGRRGPRIEPRARNALTGLALSRQGRHRAAIPHLRRAFPVLGGPHQMNAPAEALRLYYPVDFRDAVEAGAASSGLPAHTVYGMIREESAFDVTALSHAGARGLMQLMPATAREVSRRLGQPYSTRRLDEPAFNVRLGSAYFAQVLEMFDGRTELALAGYNGGPYRMKRLWRKAGPEAEIDFFTEALPVVESKGYVKRVILFANSYREMYGL